MDIKGLFFNTDEEIKEAQKGKIEKPVHPKAEPVAKPTFSETPQTTFSDPVKSTFNPPSQTMPAFVNVSDEIVQSTIDTYQKVFDSLNQQGYDFYEYFQLVKTSGVDSAESYKMAFKMGEMMEPAINKSKLITQADYYLVELTKVYEQNNTKGNNRLTELDGQKKTESEALANEAFLLNEQLESIKAQISSNQTKLSAIDGKYKNKLDEVNSKIKANDIAKDTLVASIEKVKSGINQLIQ